MELCRYSMGIGDRFGKEGGAQLNAFKIAASRHGIDVVPVWNKSHREHTIIGSSPNDVRVEADQAVGELGWEGQYCVDADHIGRKNVELFIACSDFFTLDVAEFTGKKADECEIRRFVDKYSMYAGEFSLPGLGKPLDISLESIGQAACKYLLAVQEAAAIYRMIEKVKGAGNFVTEVSMDETDSPQTPLELLFILAAIADCGIPAQTIAPKFSGRFNKGVDYVGDTQRFAREFSDDVAIIKFGVSEFGLENNLKLSVHSGSDKFSIYPHIRSLLESSPEAGLHIKTAGTTWLEELASLAEAGGEGLSTAKKIYSSSLEHFDELCAPYSSVIDIDPGKLPTGKEVSGWSPEEFTSALNHEPGCKAYNPDMRQLLHVAYKLAAEMRYDFISLLDKNKEIVSRNVTDNILRRHILRVFPSSPGK